jgi:signal transduction histidine kinase
MDFQVAQLIVQDCKLAYALTDRDLRVTAVQGMEAILYEAEEAWLGRSLLEVVPELIASEPALAEILAGNLPRLELPLVNRETPAGQPLYVTMLDLPVRGQKGEVVGLLHVVEDNTESGLLKQRLSQNRNELRLLQAQVARQNLELTAANAELRRLAEVKSRFVAIAAHELRSPLTSISGYLEMLLDDDFGPVAEDQREPLEIAYRSASRLLEIARNLLDVTRIEAGHVELVLRPTDLAALIRTAAAEFGPRLASKAQQVTVDAAPDLPPALCDRARAAQIVGNLLSNACQYTPDGGQLRIAVRRAAEEGFLQVSVSDTGVGIPVDEQAMLFHRFFRARSAQQMSTRGAGLGLHITRSLVELHGGRIWFESESGSGSTFHVTLPIAE